MGNATSLLCNNASSVRLWGNMDIYGGEFRAFQQIRCTFMGKNLVKMKFPLSSPWLKRGGHPFRVQEPVNRSRSRGVDGKFADLEVLLFDAQVYAYGESMGIYRTG